MCVLSWSTLLRLQVALQGNWLRQALGCVHFPGLSHSGSWVLHKGTDSVGPAFCALPRSKQLRKPGAWWVHSPQVGRCVLSPPPSQPLGFLVVQQECHLRSAVCLLWGADLWLWPSWKMSTIQDPRKTWLAIGSLLAVWWRMPSLGPSLPLAFRLWLSPACLSVSGGGWASPLLASSPLVFAQSFVLWAGRQCLRLEIFVRKFSLSLFPFFLFFFFWPHHKASRILVPWPEIDLVPPAMQVKILNHWTAREVPAIVSCFPVQLARKIFFKLN